MRLVPAALLLSFGACAPAGDAACDLAKQKVRDCFGSELDQCDDASVSAINAAADCEAIASAANPDGKQDGAWCPRFLWWLCGDKLEATCSAAGNGAQYQSFSPAEQLAYHWQWGLCTEYGTNGNADLAKGWKVLTDAALGIGTSILRLDRVFTNSTDELDDGRRKLLHPYGSLVQLAYTRAEQNDACNIEYTGLWSEDSLTALARLGWGQDPKAIGYVPGIALKFFIPGRESINLHLIHSLEGDPDAPNFFGQSLTNVLPDVQSKAIKLVIEYFRHYADSPLRLRLEHAAGVYSDGTTLDPAESFAPYRVVLEPSQTAFYLYGAELDADRKVDFRDALQAIPPGTVLYEVFAYDHDGGCKQHLGTLTTKTEFRASQWGDERLYFQHAIEGQGYERVPQ